MKNQFVDTTNGMEFSVITLGDFLPTSDGKMPFSQNERLKNMVELGVKAEEMGYDVIGVGESHQKEFIASAPDIILSNIAARTKKIKLTSATTVLSLHDPVRVYENFSTLDQISDGRAEILLGRGSRHRAYELFGYDINDYDELFEEKLDLLLKLNNEQPVTWDGEYRPALKDAEFYPKPFNETLPIWRVVAQSTTSARQAALHGLPANFSYLWTGSNLFDKRVDMYRRQLENAGYKSTDFPIGISGTMYIADDVDTAIRESYERMQHTFMRVHGITMDKRNFIDAKSFKHPMLIGDAQLVRDKILYQYEQFNFQRLTLEIDQGSLPPQTTYDLMQRFAEDVMPQVKAQTKE